MLVSWDWLGTENSVARRTAVSVVRMVDVRNTLRRLKHQDALARLFAGSAGVLLIGLLAQMMAFIVVAKALGIVQFGQLTTITAVTNLAATWTGLACGEVMRRRVSRDKSHYPEALGHCILTIVVTGVVLSILVIWGLMAFMPVGNDRMQSLEILCLLVPTSIVLFGAVGQAENIFLAHDDFTSANLVNGGFAIARALTAICSCGLFGVTTLGDFAMWWLAVHVASLLICIVFVRRFGAPRWVILRNELWLGSNLAFSAFLTMLRLNLDILVLNVVSTPQVVGAYGVARRVVGIALIVPGAFDRVIYGKFAVAGADGPAATWRLAKGFLVYATAIGTVTSVVLFILAPYIPRVVGANFGESTTMVRILCWSVIFSAIQFVAFDALNASEQHGVATIVSGSANFAGAAMVGLLGTTLGVGGIYIALYLSDVVRGGALWLALGRQKRRQSKVMKKAGESS